VLAITFFVTTLLAVFVYGSTQLIKYFETRPQVIAFLEDSATDADITDLKSKLESDARIKDVKFVSKEDALEIYKNATSDNPLLGELVSPSIFPASLEFSVTDLAHTEDLITELDANEAVEKVGFTASIGGESSLGDVITRLKEIATYVRLGGAVIVGVLLTTSFLVLLVVLGLRMTIKRGEIDSLNLIGATPGFIKAPVVLEAIHYSVLGVFSGWLAAIVIILYGTPSIINYFSPIEVLPVNTIQFFTLLLAILGAELIIGILIAIFGSLFAVSRSLNITK
jgi:cell division transport system permease protein